MDLPITLQTKYGYELYCTIYSQFMEAKKYEKLHDYKESLCKERNTTEMDILHFLNDDELTKKHKLDDNDPEGWMYWKESSDRFTVLNHFYNRR